MNHQELLQSWSQEIIVMGERILRNYPYMPKSERQYVERILTKYRKTT